MTNAEARFNKSLRPRKPEGSLGRTAQDVHLDSHTAPELWTLQQVRLLLKCRLLPTTEPHTTAPYFPPVTKSYATVGFLCVVNYNRAPVQECVAGYTHHRVIPALECGVRIKIFIHCRIKIKYSLIVDKDICCLLGGGETKQQKTQKNADPVGKKLNVFSPLSFYTGLELNELIQKKYFLI